MSLEEFSSRNLRYVIFCLLMKSCFYYIVILYRYNKPHVSHCNIIIEILYILCVICFDSWITE